MQFSARNGLFLRGLLLWIALATSSLPLPVSPLMRTVAFVGAMAFNFSSTCSIFGLLPTTPSKPNFSSSCRFNSRLARARRRPSEERSTMARSSAMSTGFSR